MLVLNGREKQWPGGVWSSSKASHVAKRVQLAVRGIAPSSKTNTDWRPDAVLELSPSSIANGHGWQRDGSVTLGALPPPLRCRCWMLRD